MLLESDAQARMFVSQPRRIAARALCDRVRQSLGEEVGLRLGFGERDESRKTRLWFCSTGYLVRLVAAHPQALKTHTHIIVDDCVEIKVLRRVRAESSRLTSTPSMRRLLDGVTMPVPHRCAPDALVDFHTGRRGPRTERGHGNTLFVITTVSPGASHY